MQISLNSIGSLLTGFVFITSISSLTLMTKNVIFEDGDSIILNCTYYKSDTEDISNRYIQWQKLIGDVFKKIALFSPPGGPWPYIPYEMLPFYNNRTELIGPNISLSAVMIIKDPMCSDQGVYRCWIEYYSGISVKEQTSDSVVKFKSSPKEPEKFQLFPNKLDENQSISILCSANVGSPSGNIKIWKISQNTDTRVLIHESKATANKPGNCTEFIDDNFTYSVTRDDTGALFRCSSQNNLTQGPGPYRDSLKISVIYGPDKPVITLTPLKSFYFVGDYLTIQCITDSNPPPVFAWKFQPHNKFVETVIKNSSDVSKLVFDTLQITDSGTYSCMATNAARLNSANVTSSVSLFVRHSEISYQGCNQCGYLKVCQQYDGKTVCVTNKWVPIAIVFILISVSFAAASIVLIKNKRVKPKCKTLSASQDNGGYQAHPEIVNTHV
ncbi:carcinoembryonic antigen-related cell adhesion molecule 6-like [Magallana gigas]|uniref:carcinoembryonic antigen-related cell adhesion molecule 6-like n=1 Tax=Magallana gigas TaxID=29159 RepID=UPI00334050CB